MRLMAIGRFLHLTRSPDVTPPRCVDAFAVDQTTEALTQIDTYLLP